MNKASKFDSTGTVTGIAGTLWLHLEGNGNCRKHQYEGGGDMTDLGSWIS